MDTSSEVLPLSQLVRILLTRTLADGSNDSSCRKLLAQLNTEAYTAVSERILQDFIRDYPRYVTNDSLQALVPRHLRHLAINNCFRITPLGLHQLLTFNHCPRIETLTLSGCDQLMHDQIFQLVCETSVHLSSVTLEGCGGVTDECVKTLLKGLPQLQELNLALCSGITDQVFLLDPAGQFIRMEAGFNDHNLSVNLSSIDLSGCSQLSSTCIRHLTTLCGPTIRKINLESTRMDCTAMWYLSGYGLNSALQMALGTDSSLELPQSENPLPEIQDPAAQCRENLQVLMEEYENALDVWKTSTASGNLQGDDITKTVDEVDTCEITHPGAVESVPEGVGLEITNQVEVSGFEASKSVQHQENIAEKFAEPCHKTATDESKSVQEVRKSGKSGVMGKMFSWMNNLFNKSSSEKYSIQDSSGGIEKGGTSEAVAIPGKQKSHPEAANDETETQSQQGSNGTFGTASSRSPVDSLNFQELQLESIGSCYDSFPMDIVCKTGLEIDGLDEPSSYPNIPLDSLDSHHYKADAISYLSHVDSLDGNPRQLQPLFSVDGASIYSFQVDSLENPSRFLLQRPLSCEIASVHSHGQNCDTQNRHMQRLLSIESNNFQADSLECHSHKLMRPLSIHSYQVDSLETCDMTPWSFPTIEVNLREKKNRPLSIISYDLDSLDNYDLNMECPLDVESNLQRRKRRPVSIHSYQIDSLENYSMGINSPIEIYNKEWYDRGLKTPDTVCGSHSTNSLDSVSRITNRNSTCSEYLDSLDCDMRKVLSFGQGNDYDNSCVTPRNVENVRTHDVEFVVKPLETLQECDTISESSRLMTSMNSDDGLKRDVGLSSSNSSATPTSHVVGMPTSEGGAPAANRQSMICDSLEDHAIDNLAFSQDANDAMGLSIDADTDASKVVDNEDSLSTSEVLLGACTSNDASTDEHLSETFIKQIYKPNIISLDITDMNFKCYEMGLACLRAFFAANRSIQSFVITWEDLKDEALYFIAELATELKSLSMVGCDRLTSFGISNLTAQCSKLKNLNLQGVNFISDSAVMSMVLKGHVTTLNLAETNVTDLLLKKMPASSQNQLQCLDLSWCEELTLEGLNTLARGGGSLERLSLRQCAASDLTISLLVENCQQLTHVNLSSLQSLSDDTLVAMAENMPCLVDVDISWNSDVTDLGVTSLLRRCIHLENFVLSGIKQLTTKPFLPIIGDIASWRRSKALLLFRLHERQAHPDDDAVLTSDEEDDEIQLPHRSSSYATSLRHLHLEYCDKLDDTIMEEIVAVCRGTLTVRDYYGDNVLPRYIIDNKAQKYYPPYS